METIKKTTTAAGFVIGVVLTIVVVPLLVAIPLTMAAHVGASVRASDRCYVKGYVNSDVIASYPDFWNVKTTCYTKDGSQNIVL